ncbi:MAG: hypothetical protein HN348_33950 [Proteobacteria bacterium]|nr:hypothetical protein [Pseudomonadota bacterium]
MLLNNHLQTTEKVWALHVEGGWGNNDAFVAAFKDALGSRFSAIAGWDYMDDIWVQDEFEFGTSTAAEQRLDVIVDSIRDRGLDDFPEKEFGGPDGFVHTWGNGWANSQDSFGNLEVTPPITVDGVEYPFGRIYYGVAKNSPPSGKLTSFLDSQRLQAPVELPVDWLCVGHVDEFMTFIPDSSSDKGFRFLYSDTDLAWDILESLDPETKLPKYKGQWSGHGYRTVGEIVDDAPLRTYNDDLQLDDLNPTLETIKAEFGLVDEDIIFIPSVFEAGMQCGQYAASLIPGAINLTVATDESGSTVLFVADPFMRSDVDDQSSDPFISDFKARMPGDLKLVFVDDWDVYHLGMGEVHCGTNSMRQPVGSWWEQGRHLLEAE